MSTAEQLDGSTRLAVRIGDVERERVRAVLSRHVEDGRITLEEFSDRLGEVYAARTAAQLQRALRELPPLPAGAIAAPPAQRAAGRRRVGAAAAAFIAFGALMLAVWALTGAGFFWPLWPIVGVGFGMARSARAQDQQPEAGSHGRPGPWTFGACGGSRSVAQRR